jgi:hypothetical protein
MLNKSRKTRPGSQLIDRPPDSSVPREADGREDAALTDVPDVIAASDELFATLSHDRPRNNSPAAPGTAQQALRSIANWLCRDQLAKP